ncbi:aromatic ring-hydroxylating oxygenase subunit alpha [Legionella waltersii]|uniref:Choline monooxygenase n=1 Tax=Legionella waltersii TaxID=66969 RepID=A0A0W1A1E9_9GAMM|nr:aromatic ring-hydroxylating dioxygenase subunit alpha [Legionella waltersii]KTD75162.1 choline monooxygenase [Legionella waltersii]SNV04736.1 choline monooxygenase [Legionella waltersii]
MKEANLTQSLPAEWYYSDSQFYLEKEHLFKKEWIFLCHTQEIPSANDYLTTEVMGIPILILRDEHEQIHVLLNICRHRAAPILTEKRGTLTKPFLVCQYHAWCYHKDGRFKNAPYTTANSEALDLKKIHFEIARGMIFINFDPNPSCFESRKNRLIDEMDAAQFEIERYSFHSQMVREGDFNWKIWVEGFQECYHCPTIHPIFNKDFHMSQYEVHNKDHFSVHNCPRKVESSSGSFEGLWMWIYPNCGLPCYEKVFYTKRVNPKSPTKTELIYTFFVTNNFSETEASEFFSFIHKITDEDFKICKLVQNNLESGSGRGLFEHGYLNTARENGVHYFHQLLRSAVSPLNSHQISSREETIKV